MHENTGSQTLIEYVLSARPPLERWLGVGVGMAGVVVWGNKEQAQGRGLEKRQRPCSQVKSVLFLPEHEFDLLPEPLMRCLGPGRLVCFFGPALRVIWLPGVDISGVNTLIWLGGRTELQLQDWQLLSP